MINSIADHLSSISDEVWQDTSYVPTGGKHGVPKVANVLRQIGVPIKVVFDIDFLSERTLVKDSVTAFGGDWESVEPLWSRVDAAVRNGVKPKTTEQIKEEIISKLADEEGDRLPKGDIIELMKQAKPWAIIKKYGVRAIPKGNAQKDYYQLKSILESIGIYIIPVGEIENFCPEIGGHGPKFVTRLLSSVPLSDSRLEDLRKFVETVHKGQYGDLG